ncbi:receptor like protein kinase S.2 isoform X1 [Lolium perenne]|uniref:receptor like protein kinase S.2 isoform X1 n=1 Tax=Lolium perenne TaxID=4522 RepID=UPI003A9965EE
MDAKALADGIIFNIMENKSHHVSDEPMKMSFKLLQEITNNFDEDRRLGNGAFGEVYKGVLDGKDIAVKKLRAMPGIDEKQFENEFGHLRRLKHQNIVQLVGFCNEEEEVVVTHEGKEVLALDIHRALCLEFVPNGSLGSCLSGQCLGLDWDVRFRIIKGICEGLKYLHDVSVMHFDLKPDNILLDEKMVPKIADFGLSRLVGKENTIITMTPLGTLGFLPPEFINKQVISKEYDIFSLGAIIRRILTGVMDKDSIPDMDERESCELTFLLLFLKVHNYWKEKLEEIPAQSLEAVCKQVRICIEIAVDCMETDRRKRPKMKEIVRRLKEVETKDNQSCPQINQWKLSVQSIPHINTQASESSLLSTLPKKLSSEYLKAITDGFSLERKLGQGSFGTMYKGILEDGTEISVEKLEESSSVIPEKTFQSVVANIMAHRHENIVKLVGFCYETEKKMVEQNETHILADVVVAPLLCFEYVPNGNLAKYIYGESCQLDWNTRLKIIVGICQAFKWMCYIPIVHTNLTPKNILLDNNMRPKIAGFGVSRLFDEGLQRSTWDVVGELQYIAPEYLQKGEISSRADMYNLGVLILEIATGEKISPQNEENLYSATLYADNVRQNWTDDDISWNYPSLETCCIDDIKTCIMIGLMCVEMNPRRRPCIVDIVDKLRYTTSVGAMPNMISGCISFLRVQPRRLCFPCVPKRLNSSSLYLTNSTKYRIAFSLQTDNPRRYHTMLPFCGIVPSKCSYTLTVTMREQKKRALSNNEEFLTLQSSIMPAQDLKNVTPDSVAVFFEEVRIMGDHEVQEVKIPVVCNPPDVTAPDQVPVACNPPDKAAPDQSIRSAAIVTEIIATQNYRQVLSIHVHSTEPWILTTNNRGNVSIWNYHTKTTVNSFEVNNADEPVYSAKFIEREKWLVVGGSDGYIYVYSYESYDTMEVECFKAHDGYHITSLAVEPTHSLVLSTSADHMIKLWTWEKGWECIQTFLGHYNKVTQVMFDPRDSNRFVSASLDRTVKIWGIDSATCNITLHGHTDGVLCLQYFSSDNQQFLMAGSSDGAAKIWDLATECPVSIIEGDGNQLNALCLHPELPLVITGLQDGTIQIRKSTSTAYRLENITGFNLGAVKALEYINGPRRIVVGCDQGIAMMEVKVP